MKSYFLTINDTKRAWVAFLAASVGAIVSAWTPPPVTIALLIVLLPVGVFSFAYLCVNSFWPALTNHWPKFRQCLYATGLSIRNRLTGKKSKNLPPLLAANNAAFFAQRFAEAFPGVREITWYERREAIKRLKVLLGEPLVFKAVEGYTIPIWWWRDGNLHISSFRVISKHVVLLNNKELNIARIAAVPSRDYYRFFVYLEATPMEPCGAYEWNEEKIRRWVADHGYAWEEYGLYKRKHIVNRAEYDDNAAVIRGRLVNLNDDVELRERYITSYNCVIAPNLSPINNMHFDAELRDFMDMMLTGDADIAELKKAVHQLPRHRARGE